MKSLEEIRTDILGKLKNGEKVPLRRRTIRILHGMKVHGLIDGDLRDPKITPLGEQFFAKYSNTSQPT
jgi:hypothetical protein